MKLLKNFLCGVLSMVMLTTGIVVSAEDGITVRISGKTIDFDVPPQIINERTMVPLRAIFEALGASVNWDEATRTITSEKDGTSIKMTVDSSVMYVNDNEVTLDSPACIVDGRTLVPVRAISEAYNTNVDWNGDTKTVIISSTDNGTIDTQSNENNTVNSSPGNLLASQIINKGSYNKQTNLYSVYEYNYLNKKGISLLLSCKMKDDNNVDWIGFVFTSEKDKYTSKVSLIIDEVNGSSVKSTFTSQFGEQTMFGLFSSTDGKFYKVSSSYDESIYHSTSEMETFATEQEQLTIDIINNSLKESLLT